MGIADPSVACYARRENGGMCGLTVAPRCGMVKSRLACDNGSHPLSKTPVNVLPEPREMTV